jgi:ABC-type phosphate/phosphonate transport system permease subunit
LVFALVTIEMPLISAFGLFDEVVASFGSLYPPDFTTAGPELWQGIRETIAIGFTATTLGLVLAIPLGILSARNIMFNRAIYSATRLFLLALRGLPELIVAVLFVAAMGLGPVPGTLALTLGTATFMAKLIGDALEEVSPKSFLLRLFHRRCQLLLVKLFTCSMSTCVHRPCSASSAVAASVSCCSRQFVCSKSKLLARSSS